MKVTIQAINFRVAGFFTQKIRQRVLKLNTYFDKIIRTDVLISKDSNDKEGGYHCKLILSKKGNNLFTKSKAGSIEEAVNMAVEGMRRRLRKLKTVKTKFLKKRQHIPIQLWEVV